MSLSRHILSFIFLLSIGVILSKNIFAQTQDIKVDQSEESAIVINSFKIEGYENIEKKEIKDSLATRFPSIKPWENKPVFDEDVFEDDLARLKKLFASHGYYDAELTHTLKFSEKKDSVDILINVNQGDPIILKDLIISFPVEGYQIIENEINKKINLEVSKRFSAIKFQDSKDIISEILSNNGYPKPIVKAEARVSKKNKTAEAEFNIDPGLIYTFGSISIVGYENIDRRLIEREITFSPGQTFSKEAVNETRRRIFQLGFYKSVIIDLLIDPSDFTVNININVVERKLGTVRVGAGFATEDKLRGHIRWTQRNLFGGGQRLNVIAKASFITQRIETSITQPYFFGENSELIGLLNFQRDDLPSYEGYGLRATARNNKRFGKKISTFASVNVIFSRINSQASRTPIEESQENVYLLTFDAGIRYNSTDSLLNPTRGVFAGVAVETSFQGLSSDQSYVKSFLELKGYKKFKKFVFASRFELGMLEPFGSTGQFDIPIFKRFFAGGSTSMRGFPFLKLGPLDDNEDPLGGNSLILGNVEARFPLYNDFGGVLFLDVGNVYPESFDYRLDDLRYAVGAGIRYDTRIGPVRFDVGYTLNPVPELTRYQFWITIGQAF